MFPHSQYIEKEKGSGIWGHRGDLSCIVENGTLKLREVQKADSGTVIWLSPTLLTIQQRTRFYDMPIIRKRNLLLLNALSVQATK